VKEDNEFNAKKIKNVVFNLFYVFTVEENDLGKRERNKGEMREKRQKWRNYFLEFYSLRNMDFFLKEKIILGIDI
jgi:hypothetical protein